MENELLSVEGGFFSPVICGKEVASTAVALDNLDKVDLFPIAAAEIDTGMLDHIDWLVLPDGDKSRYPGLLNKNSALLDAYVARGGKMIAWGAGAEHLPDGGVRCKDGAEVTRFLAAEADK